MLNPERTLRPMALDTHFAARFGRHCLNKVEERDVDLILLEGMNCEPMFQEFVGQLILGKEAKATFLEACNSVSTASGGESDLIALYEMENEVVALMLENKDCGSIHALPSSSLSAPG